MKGCRSVRLQREREAPAIQDGVPVETRRAGTSADLTAAQGITVPRHIHATIRPTSILYLAVQTER